MKKKSQNTNDRLMQKNENLKQTLISWIYLNTNTEEKENKEEEEEEGESLKKGKNKL